MSGLPSRDAALWLVPVVLALGAFLVSSKAAEDIISASLAIVIFVFMMNRPGVAIITLAVYLPFELLGLSLLLSVHVPSTLLRGAAGLKELLALAILVAGLRAIRDNRRRLDRIDIAVLAYVAAVTLYLVVPHLFSPVATTQWSPRILAWRTDAAYPLIFFGARHAPIGPRLKEQFMRVVLGVGLVVALLGLYQRLQPVQWSNFILHNAHVVPYELNVLRLAPQTVGTNLGYILNINPLRVSSTFLSPFDMGDFMVLVTAVAAVRITQNHRSLINYVVLAASLGANFFTRSRSDGLAAVVILVLIALPTSRHPLEGRLRLIGALLVAAVIVVPSLGGTRYVGAQGGSVSATGHLTEIEDGLRVFAYAPFGLGLGAQPGVTNRISAGFTVLGGDVSDNSILQVVDELGVQALVPWLFMLGFVLVSLKRRASRGDPLAAAMGFALLGVLIAGEYHHAFLTFPLPWTLWAGVGLALSADRPAADEEKAGLTTVRPLTAGVR
jgi:hypothetical protein